MCCRKFFLLLLATIFALICPPINGASLEKRPYDMLDNPGAVRRGAASPPDVNSTSVMSNETTAAAPAAAATPETAATSANSALLATPATFTGQSQITAAPPPPSGSAGCVPWATCNLFYPYVNVYYWPEDPQNTACLSKGPQITTPSPDVTNIQSPSVYVNFPSIRAHDGCSQIGATFTNLITSFAPSALSTIGGDSKTYSFNFGDLPCPPAIIGWNSSQGPYAPLLAPPEFLFHLDPAFLTCIHGASQGIDPYTALVTTNAASGPGKPGCRRPCN
ncbi:hypothetical protein HO133_008195 [Letharia lupina]|uniref:Uncharacterized protein n=1 Tax=Letharia lupina TaxID=560253 RepID=A0A8H6CRC6_9LECA|nr:uncharacterized protein HO133_008195 [Letharia lupina]KAF6228465.1 hypothetical protein HO133_008195 [Letharia lupina]